MKLLLLFLLIGTALVGAQNNDTNVTGGGSDGDESDAPARWGGCGADTKVKIGSPMLLCLHVAKGTDWSDGVDFIRLAFNPKADEYSRFHVPNCKFVENDFASSCQLDFSFLGRQFN